MSADNFTGQFISSTYQRLLQLSDNGDYVTDGTGSVVNFLPVTASYVLNGGSVVFPYTGSAIISGSLIVTGSVHATSMTSSLLGTSSWAVRAVTSSYALQAQNAAVADVADTANQSDNVLVKGYDAHENGVVYPFLIPKNLDIPANGQGYSSLVNNNDFLYTSYDSGTPAFSMPVSTSIFIIGAQGQNSASLIVHGEIKATKFTTLTNTIEFTDLIVTGSRPAILSLSVSSSNLVISGGGLISNVTGSLLGTSSWAMRAVTASHLEGYDPSFFIVRGDSGLTQTVTGSFNVSGSFGLYSQGNTNPTSTPSRTGLFYFTDTDMYISLD